ncbi:MAG TPA: hypothetical protein VLB90_08325 [Pseudomonadales bacterium]|nr:hypothetical protein [Pseudomonadales bacterium]
MRSVIHLSNENEHPTNVCSVRLLLTNFHLQSAVDIKNIISLLKKCPSFHLQGLQEILYDPLRQMQQPLLQARRYVPSHIKGQYLQHLHSIVLYPFCGERELLHTIAHELGHFVFLHRLDSTVRKKWVTEIYPGSEKVSKYASTNASEDFAESYAFYLLSPEALRPIAEKYAFMEKEVFLQPTRSKPGELHLKA